MSKYPGLEYCKVDLVATKGVVFCKFYRASAALAALEDINASGMVRPPPRAATPVSGLTAVHVRAINMAMYKLASKVTGVAMSCALFVCESAATLWPLVLAAGRRVQGQVHAGRAKDQAQARGRIPGCIRRAHAAGQAGLRYGRPWACWSHRRRCVQPGDVGKCEHRLAKQGMCLRRFVRGAKLGCLPPDVVADQP